MRIETTDAPLASDEDFVVEQTRAYNRDFTEKDVRRLCVFARDEGGAIIGGLTGKTYWRYLDVAFLWVHREHRGQGIATQLLAAAENEARRRGCQHVLLDTYSFQALGLYRKLGFQEFGQLSGFSDKHTRHYLTKPL